MKNLLVSLNLILLIAKPCFAQTQSNLSTPKGSPVTAYIVPEMSNSERGYWDSYWSLPNRTQIITSNNYSSSQTFNCHGYAWSIVEGGPTRWIGYYYTTDEDIYMTDGSYVQVCSETYPAKVSWGSGDHSAVTTATPGIWISKWNKYPLMQHAWDDTPYGATNLKYYVSTKISGNNSLLCSGTRTFSVQSIAGASYTWSVNSFLQIVSGQGTNQLTVQRNGNANGVAVMTVQVYSPCVSSYATSPELKVVVGTENNAVDIISVNISCINNSARADLIFSPMFTTATKIDYYSKDLTNPNNPYILKSTNSSPNGGTGGDLTLGAKNRWYSIKMVVTTPCGTLEGIREVYAACSGGGGALRAFPNPTNNQFTVQLVDGSTKETESQTNPAKESNVLQIPFTTQLFDSQGMLRKSTKEGKGSLTIDTSDLPNGIYYLHAQTATEKLTSQIIVKH
jgi:hypothetical protein